MELEEQENVLKNDKKNMLVSASAGSGKTYIMIKYICQLICEKKIPIEKMLVLTFTKAAAAQMKDRLLSRLKEQKADDYVISQIDALSTANISTIHAFCEKYLKKYANLLNLDEKFSIIDENLSQKMKSEAFSRAIKRYKEESVENYSNLLNSFKNNTKQIKEIVLEIEKLSVAVADKEKFLADNFEKTEEFFKNSCDYLFNYAKTEITNSLAEIEKLHVEDFYQKVKLATAKIVESKNYEQLSKDVEDFSFPKMPLRKVAGNEVVDKLNSIKKRLLEALGQIEELSEDERKGVLEKQLLELFVLFDEEQDKLKKMQNILDFNDLEKYMNILSKQENLFSNLEYVFVDEYQDTNKIQEKIIKNISKNCNFVAVGDVKQGIYGFRLASSQIFLKDLKEFTEDKNSQVNFLQSNFRSSQKVLDFVNDIFKVCMQKQLTGVDYANTSMLEGKSEFAEEDAKAVNIDLVDKQIVYDAKIPEVYSVKEADITEQNCDNLLNDIKRRIFEVLGSKISEDGKLRQARFSDIAILSRKRDQLFLKLEEFLQDSGLPFISNSRSDLLEQGEIQMLLNFLKVVLYDDDEVALLSVLCGGLMNYKLEEIFELKKDKKLSEIVKNEQKFADFREKIDNFRLNFQIFGLRKAFDELFLQTQYRTYINQTESKLMPFVDKFLEQLEMFDFDLPGAINYFENVDISVTPEVSVVEDSILLTTIHNSKGLEYPIVFLIGCDQSLSKARVSSEVKINEQFGLAVKVKSLDDNQERTTARMRVITIAEKQKDFVEELMIFYVALTRAKNRLYIFGEYKDSIFKKQSLTSCDSYFDFIFYALKDVKKKFLTNDKYESPKLEIQHLNVVEPQKIEQKDKEGMPASEEIIEKINNYLDFEYVLDDNLNYRLKESVTALTRKQQEEKIDFYSNENFKFGSNMLDIGNAYHAALKAIDFEKVTSLVTLEEELNLNSGLFDASLIDKELLLRNIFTLKKFTSGGKVYKEKEFLLREKLNNLVSSNAMDEILVQGIVDLFVVKNKEIILVDYKFSNYDKNLVEKYKEQLKLYKIALSEAFNMPVREIYLLSLKTNTLFKIEF